MTVADDWAMIIEPNGFLCTAGEAVRALSSAGEVVSFYYNENTTPRFAWSIGGENVVGFDPTYPYERYGTDPGRLNGMLAEVGFVLAEDGEDDEQAVDDDSRERTFALMEQLAGVRWDAGFLRRASFRCAGSVAGGRDSVVLRLFQPLGDLASRPDPDLELEWGGRIPSHVRLLEPEVQPYARGLIPYDRTSSTGSPRLDRRRSGPWRGGPRGTAASARG